MEFTTTNDDEDTQSSTTSSSSTSNDMSPTQTQVPKSSWTGSIVEYYGPSASYCGYCKQGEPHLGGDRRSYDMIAPRLTASDYQDLLDRGWRRSGRSCYYPINQITCCPNFSITCPAIKFQLSRSQRETIKRFNNFLYGDSIKYRAPIDYEDTSQDLFEPPTIDRSSPAISFDQLKKSSKAKHRRFILACERVALSKNISSEEAMKLLQSKWAKYRQKILSLEDYLYPRRFKGSAFGPKHELRLNMIHVASEQSQELREEEHKIIVDYQKQVHNDHQREWTMPRFCDFLVASPIMVERLKDYDYVQTSDEDETDTLSKDIFTENSSFVLHRPPQLPTAYGTYHCSYHLDGELIAIGVLDVLPKCITTVYFFYDPKYSFLNLGVYSALVEISMIRQMWSRFRPAMTSAQEGPQVTRENILKHYYLGFYVHECQKMHYKTHFKPSYLLCCKSLEYIETQKCLEKLRDTKFTEFSPSSTTSSDPQPEREEIEFQKLLEVTIEWPRSIKAANRTKLLNYLLWLETNFGTGTVELFVNGYLATFAHLVGPDLLAKLCLRTDIVHATLVRRHHRLG